MHHVYATPPAENRKISHLQQTFIIANILRDDEKGTGPRAGHNLEVQLLEKQTQTTNDKSSRGSVPDTGHFCSSSGRRWWADSRSDVDGGQRQVRPLEDR